MKDNPTGKQIDISTTKWAFYGFNGNLPAANNITIKNLTIEKYASLLQRSPIGIRAIGDNWLIENFMTISPSHNQSIDQT